ncbi:hypothetical protein RT95_05790 [Xanthomonas campestris]|nr:hypothetical protein RT95_05790 [Xanthomonas campestris]
MLHKHNALPIGWSVALGIAALSVRGDGRSWPCSHAVDRGIGALAGALHAEHADAGRCGVLHLSIGTQSDQPQCHLHPHQRAAKHV